MKNKVWLFTATLLLFTAGCGEPDMAQNKINSNEQKTAGISDTDETESEIDSSASEKMEAAEEKYIWKEITLQFPESWKDKYVILEDDTGFSVFQKKSYEKESGTGFLFGITKDTEWYPDAAGVSILGYTDDGVLYEVVRPTDVSCDVENEDTLNEYQGMMQQSDTVVQNAVIDTQNLHKDADQYIIPVSMTQTISADSLINMSDNDLWLARNEIYARHGRGFSNEYMQSYFNACSWYEKSEEADAFDESVLSQTEKDNLKVIQEAETAYEQEHPYPKEYKTGQNIMVDLNGDGSEEEIRYDVKESSDYSGYSCVLTVNGTAYELCEYAAMVTPETESFYVTDMDEYDNSLEIAVLDDGPSADYATYFTGMTEVRWRLSGKWMVSLLRSRMAESMVLPGKTESMEQSVQIFLKPHILMDTGGMTAMHGNWNIWMAVCINTSISHRTDYMWIFRCGKLWIRIRNR